MKTAIFSESRRTAGARRVALRSAVLVAVLAAGNLWASPVVKTLGGGASPTHYGYQNGETLYSYFHTPMGLALSQAGNLFVADYGNNAIRELTDMGGTYNGTTLTYVTNHVSSPVGVAVDSVGNLFVLNRGGTATISTNGSVIEFNQYGILTATNATHLTNAVGIALDSGDDIYVTERSNLLIKITGGVQSTVATITAPGALLKGIVVTPSGNIAACDAGRDGIYTITPGGIVTTNAGFNGPGDGTGPDNIGVPNSLAQFFQPSGIAAAGDGTLIVSDFGNDRVKVITASGITTNFYGVSSNDWISANPPYQDPGWVDGTVVVPDQIGGVAGRCPFGVTISSDGTTVYTTEDFYHIIRQVTGGGFMPLPPPAPVPVTGLTATVITNSEGALEVSLLWNAAAASEGVTNYILERSTSGSGYTNLTETTGTSFTDTSVSGYQGTTFYYVVVAENAGGNSQNSEPAVVTIPILPPPSPSIGWFDYEFNGTIYVSVFHNISGVFSTENDLDLAINPNANGVFTYYVDGPTPLSESPTNNGSSPPPYENNKTIGSITPLPVNTSSNLTIEAVNENNGEYSAVVSVQIDYQCGVPSVLGTNAAYFELYDLTTNVTYYYTTDGTDPLTNTPPNQQIISTNGLAAQVSINISSNFVFAVRAMRAGYAPSPEVTNEFLAQNYQNNELTWGFASGEASSKFIASPGEIFYAPVTLTILPGIDIYSMQFNMVETNLGVDAVPSGQFGFTSMLKKPGFDTNTDTKVLVPIPPFMFIGEASSPPPPSQIVSYEGTNFENLVVTNANLNELAVGWYEMYPQTNLYDTGSQDLIAISQAYIDEYLQSGQKIIVGGYAFQVPTNAQPGEQYQIQLNRPSADSDGLGASGSAVTINLPTTGSLTNGAVNSIKIVTVGQPKYLAGDVYPFEWFNAGDFGYGDLYTYGAEDVQDVFDAAVYDLNVPPAGSDFYDAMDSAGGMGMLDGQTGYWTNSGAATPTQISNLYNLNDDTTINQMAFGDSNLDVCDVFVTFVRSEFPNLVWFQRFYTNDTTHGIFGRVAQAIYSQTNVNNAAMSAATSMASAQAGLVQSPASITNTPTVHFAAGDYLASAGQSISIPITATVFGPNPARMLMFNVSVTPLDGSPALTSDVTFTPIAPFNDPDIYNPVTNYAVGSCAAAFLPLQLPIPPSADITGSNVIGYLNLTIPANATSMSAYDLAFTHASASPNGLISFPRTTYTGLITLSSRTSSYYNDGIPDSWRLRYFGTIYNELSVSNADADGTGMNNWQKYLAGLNPVDSTSVLNEGTDQHMAQSLQDLVLYWPSVAGQTYVVKRSPTLFPPQWTCISTNIGDGTYMEIHDTSGGNSRFYEVTTP